MIGPLEIFLLSLLVFTLFFLYLINRQDTLRFLFEMAVAVMLALAVHQIGLSTLFAYLGFGITLGSAYFIRK